MTAKSMKAKGVTSGKAVYAMTAPMEGPGIHADWRASHKDMWNSLSANKRFFLEIFSECLTVSRTCKFISDQGMNSRANRRKHNYWLAVDPVYFTAFNSMEEQVTRSLEDEAIRRAHFGVEEPIYQGGCLVGTKQVYSDQLLMFVLRARDPAKYREKSSVEITGKNGGPITYANLDEIIRDMVVEDANADVIDAVTMEELSE